MDKRDLIIDRINSLAEEKYRDFSAKLIPGCENILGVRVPLLRKLVSDIIKNGDAEEFLSGCRYEFYEETMIAGMVIGKSDFQFEKKKALLKEFLPHVDNWGVCDICASDFKSFKRDGEPAYLYLAGLAVSKEAFTARFGIVTLLSQFFNTEYFHRIKEVFQSVTCGDYYVDMALAWAISVGLVKFYEETLPLLQSGVFPKFVHNTAIKKAVESFRITDEVKEYLKTLRA
ncbi:MAG: DNA alkylation repair protein [Clostridiaceae bacterium]|jgi:3-methyladenine DNA glycosylase AlkD|nr:DNA alkylation repair protein [Clostridiaceae bacterium]